MPGGVNRWRSACSVTSRSESARVCVVGSDGPLHCGWWRLKSPKTICSPRELRALARRNIRESLGVC